MPSDRLQYALSSSVGMVLGAFISLIVDSALFEIGESKVFATVFGVCLMLIGGLIVWRVAPVQGEAISRWRYLVFIFSSMVFTSGICCFLVEKGWLVTMNRWVKLPMYTLLGTSLSFALTFSLLDLINNAALCSGAGTAEALLGVPAQSSRQVYVVLFSSVFMGGLFGSSFGMIDVEDDSRMHTRFDEDQAINTMIGAVTGLFVGGANQYLRDKALVDAAPYVTLNLSEDEEF
mmetsp:Transcript_27583/g.55885  ORF Transcript_27583/g.55885 Transcript_27583/m.55885 type:complete len:233 (-) Transcript_27583:79-777(-)|eukprot:CAMPEP_0196723838 /NCGR_PEP_ID=MMETSP1091-20130531/5902_1 /TAXON_ID=302021 /ORGANISM="Rhodomonas sp., Strain CCMP768" /LENGTH=232 /DNA_ID=CAMNT_0042065871 /DNA_START=73 /DNA_END=771 /DNA_ORIENTATION=-